jgi:cell division protease FtsH
MALSDRRDQVFLGEEIAQRREFSEATAQEVDQEIKLITQQAFQQAKDILQEQRENLDDLVAALLEHEEIPGEEVMRLLGIGEAQKA